MRNTKYIPFTINPKRWSQYGKITDDYILARIESVKNYNNGNGILCGIIKVKSLNKITLETIIYDPNRK